MVDKFARQFLRHDGIFVLRMLAINAGEMICSEIVQKLWIIFKQKYYNRNLNKAPGGDEECEYNDPNRTIIHLEGDAVAVCGEHTPSAPPNNMLEDGVEFKKEHL